MKKVTALCSLLLLLGLAVYAQEYGGIRGVVADKDGNPLPGVSITLSGSKVGERTAVTSKAAISGF